MDIIAGTTNDRITNVSRDNGEGWGLVVSCNVEYCTAKSQLTKQDGSDEVETKKVEDWCL